MAFIDDLLGTGVNIAGIENARQDIQTAGTNASTAANTLATNARTNSAFKPFTVTTNLGTTKADADGGLDTSLSPKSLAFQNSMLAGAQNNANISSLVDPFYGQFNQSAQQQATAGLGQVNQLDPTMLAQRQGMSGLFGNQLSQYSQPTGFEGLTQQSLMQGQQMLGQGQQAPQDIEALRAQYGAMAGQANQQYSQFDRAGRQSDIYSQLRGMQQPEEERQRLQLEQRLQAQGRGGVQTAQYGGTPEQLAMAKAQAEAQNQAGLMAMQQTGSEQDRALQAAMGLGSQTGQMAGLSSNLQSQGQQMGLSMAQFGMQGTQQQQQMMAQRQQMLQALQQGDIGAAGAQQSLQQGQLGLTSGMFGLGQQAAQMPAQMQGQQLQNMLMQLQGAYTPEDKMLNQVQAGTNVASMADQARRFGVAQETETGMSGIEAKLASEQSAAQLQQQYYQIAADLAGSKNAANQGMIGQVISGLGGSNAQGTGWADNLPASVKRLLGIS